jgi:hypothetical protein
MGRIIFIKVDNIWNDMSEDIIINKILHKLENIWKRDN